MSCYRIRNADHRSNAVKFVGELESKKPAKRSVSWSVLQTLKADLLDYDNLIAVGMNYETELYDAATQHSLAGGDYSDLLLFLEHGIDCDLRPYSGCLFRLVSFSSGGVQHKNDLCVGLIESINAAKWHEINSFLRAIGMAWTCYNANAYKHQSLGENIDVRLTTYRLLRDMPNHD